MAGFEPTAPSSRTKCATKLRYIPFVKVMSNATTLTSSAPWVCLPLQVGAGPEQMQTDLQLLAAHQRGDIRGALRFYCWQPVAISLGYHQRHWPEHWQHCHYRGQRLPILRRPSGGAAVLHQGDVCFALVMGITPGHYREQWQRLLAWLIDGWRTLGVSLQTGPQKPVRGQVSCFAQATPADLVTAAGHKFIGMAQRRWGRSLLVQGSMQIHPDPELWMQVFGTTAPPPVPTPPIPVVVAHLTATVRAYLDDEPLGY
jgi:lipoate-protein ligase A